MSAQFPVRVLCRQMSMVTILGSKIAFARTAVRSACSRTARWLKDDLDHIVRLHRHGVFASVATGSLVSGVSLPCEGLGFLDGVSA